jgi:putative SOS response-associated peptidase YedK
MNLSPKIQFSCRTQVCTDMLTFMVTQNRNLGTERMAFTQMVTAANQTLANIHDKPY